MQTRILKNLVHICYQCSVYFGGHKHKLIAYSFVTPDSTRFEDKPSHPSCFSCPICMDQNQLHKRHCFNMAAFKALVLLAFMSQTYGHGKFQITTTYMFIKSELLQG